MELLRASHSPICNSLSGFNGRSQIEWREEVYVTVSKSVDKAVSLIQWACKTFGNSSICILHVLVPSPSIPTLLGRLPATQANPQVVAAFRNAEREEARRHLSNICCRSKVKASVAIVEADHVLKGILDFVNKHNIKKLMIGAIPELPVKYSCVKVKKSSRKASYAAANLPLFCEIFFVYKGKLIWTRQPPECSSFVVPISSNTQVNMSGLRSPSLKSCQHQAVLLPEPTQSCSSRDLSSSGIKSSILDEGTDLWPVNFSSTSRSDLMSVPTSSISTGSSPGSSCASSSAEPEQMNKELESLYKQLAEVSIEYESSRNRALSEMVKRKKLEAEAVEAMREVKAFETNNVCEVELRKEAENVLGTILLEKEKLLKDRQEITCELQKAMRNIALLETCAHEANQRCGEVAGELALIHASIASLRQEKLKLQQQKAEAEHWIDWWKNHGKVGGGSRENGFIQCKLVEFSPSDLQTATCNFSESFRIGQGGYADVYKGELSNKTVAIKQLHPYNMQQLSQFFEQVEILAKLRHPHLVTLIGVCPEAWCLVYEYLPGQSLHDCLFSRNTSPMNWEIRVRIIAEIASALLYLHSVKIVHGDLIPENVLLDCSGSCKISGMGLSRLIPQQALRCPSFNRLSEPKGLFSYTDPEFHINGALSPKSDIYSYGLIILQMLTGRNVAGLVSEVRMAVSSAHLEYVMDSSAGEWSTFVSRRLAQLALQCCEANSRDRPELTPALIMELENLHMLEERLVPSFFLCPIRQDIMHEPQLAGDGFTYEGEAIQAWLGSGHDTSPMTNLKLSHLELTPNHALRLAIQDWLRKS